MVDPSPIHGACADWTAGVGRESVIIVCDSPHHFGQLVAT